MPRKVRLNAKQVATELAHIALKHLSTLPEDEQEARINAAERRLSKCDLMTGIGIPSDDQKH